MSLAGVANSPPGNFLTSGADICPTTWGIVQVKKPRMRSSMSGLAPGTWRSRRSAGHPLQQPRAPYSGPALTGLLEFDQIGSDQPVPEDEVAIDGSSGTGLRLLVGVADGGDEGWVVHGKSREEIKLCE